jgi:hypothetical protein
MRISLFIIVLCFFACKNEQSGGSVSHPDTETVPEQRLSPEQKKEIMALIDAALVKASALEQSYIETEKKMQEGGKTPPAFTEKLTAGRSEVSQIVLDLKGYKESGQRNEGLSLDLLQRLERIDKVILPEYEAGMKSLSKRLMDK